MGILASWMLRKIIVCFYCQFVTPLNRNGFPTFGHCPNRFPLGAINRSAGPGITSVYGFRLADNLAIQFENNI
jgi:hypothetical protein